MRVDALLVGRKVTKSLTVFRIVSQICRTETESKITDKKDSLSSNLKEDIHHQEVDHRPLNVPTLQSSETKEESVKHDQFRIQDLHPMKKINIARQEIAKYHWTGDQ